MIDWARCIVERHGKPIGAVALARKLAGILFAMWLHGTSYQSKRSAEVAIWTSHTRVNDTNEANRNSRIGRVCT